MTYKQIYKTIVATVSIILLFLGIVVFGSWFSNNIFDVTFGGFNLMVMVLSFILGLNVFNLWEKIYNKL